MGAGGAMPSSTCTLVSMVLFFGISTAQRRAAVVIDITNEQYLGPNGTAIWHKEQVLNNVAWLLGQTADSPKWDAIFDCRNWIYNTEDAAWGPEGWHGGIPGSEGAKLIPRLAELRDRAASITSLVPWRFVGKPTMSCLHDTSMQHALLTLRVDELYVMGINTDQCVFMTIVDAWRTQAVRKVILVRDAATSYYGQEGHDLGLRMIDRVPNASVVNTSQLHTLSLPLI